MVMEVVGLAGSGKSTIFHALIQQNENIQAGCSLKKSVYLAFLISIAPMLILTLPYQYRNNRWLSWKEIRVMVYLKATNYILKKQTVNNHNVTILDQGPVFMLTWLRVFVLNSVRSRRLNKWWDDMLNQLSAQLDMIIRLEAPYKILAERIHERKKTHRIKGQSDQDVYELLTRYQISYDHIITRLTRNGGPKVSSFNTYHKTLNDIVDRIVEFT